MFFDPNGGGNPASAVATFNVSGVAAAAAPTVTSLTNTSGPTAGGTSVTINGTGFSATPANNSVKFGTTAATITSANAGGTQLVVTAPASAAGVVDVTVTVGGATSATSVSDQFTYVAAPTITSISPNSGPPGGGTSVTLTGTNLTGTTGVTVGGTAVTSFANGTATRITFTTPAGSVGARDVVVTTAGGSVTAIGGFTYIAPPTAGPVSATVAFNSTANPITLSLGGGAATSVAVSVASHGTTAASGTSITYTPTTGYSGPDSFTYTATNAGGTSSPAGTVTITVSPATAPVAMSFTAGTTVAYGSSGNTIDVSGHVTGTTTGYSVVSGTTTGGGSVSISSVGVATYTPLASFRGSDTFQFKATNADSASSAATVTAIVGNPTFAVTLPAPSGTLGNGYNTGGTPVTLSGGTAPYSAISATGLPNGLVISASGVISGAPTADCSCTVVVTATDSSTGNGPFTSTASASLMITGTALSTAQAVPTTSIVEGAQASFTPVTASGGFGTVTFAVTAGTLPTGLTILPSNGTISGMPTVLSPTTSYTVTATDSSTPTAQTSSKTFSLTVTAPVLTTTTAVPTTSIVEGAQASFTPVTASGGFGTVTFAVTAGTLPTGLTILPSNGTISGMPTVLSPTTSYTVTATDSSTPTAQTSSKTFSLTVTAPVLTTTTAVPTTSIVEGAQASFTPVTASGGFGTVTFAVTAGTLPTGLTILPSNGTISGMPTVLSPTTSYTVTATDSSTPTAQTSSKTFSLTVTAPVLTTTTAVPTTSIVEGAQASFTPVTASGGFGTVTFAVTAGTLPTGLTILPSNGTISGMPTVLSSTTSYTVTATDSSTPTPQSSSKTFSLTVTAPVLTTTTAVPTTSIVEGAQASFTPVTASGGFGTITFAVTGGTLPLGLSIATATGTIFGTPTVASPATSYTVTATDSATPTAQTSSKTFSLTVTVPAPTATAISPATGVTTGGTAVTITGTDFTGATGVTIGGVAATGVTVVSATSLSAVTPPGSVGPVSVVVTTPRGANPANTLYTYTAPIVTVTGLSPASGPLTGGTSVTITGTAFTGTTAVKFGTIAATSFTFNSATSITALSPAGAVGPVDVTVTAARVTSPTGPSDTFTYKGAPVAEPVTAVAPPSGGPFTITPVLSGGAATSVAVAAQPSHGTARISGTAITYTPAPGFVGTDTFTYTATNAQGTSAPATITVTVTKATTAVALTSSTSSAVFGAPVSLTALVVGAAPTGTVTFKEAGRALGIARVSGTTATFTIASLSIGSHVFVATYSGDADNLAATSRVLSISITARPNPALNADVTGLVTAEVSTATRFGQTQINNTFHRLEELHDEDDGADAPKTDQASTSGRGGKVANGGRPQPNAEDAQQADTPPAAFGGTPTDAYGALGDGPAGKGRLGNGVLASAAEQGFISGDLPTTIRPDSQSQTGRAFQALSGMAIPATFAALNKRGDLPFHLWFAGAVDYGSLSGDGSMGNRFVYNNSFTTSGLTFGADRRFTSKLKAGVAVGVGFDHTAVGTDGTKSDARSYNATLYASYRFLPHTYLDAIAGYGRLGFDLNRWSTDGNVMLAGTRKGSDVFGSLVLTHDARWGAWRVSPYSRLDVVRVDLDAYDETGSDIWALHYNDLETPTISAVVGARLGYTIPVSWGTLTPMVRMEYSHALTGTYNQTLSYADLPGTNYLISGLPIASNLFTGGVSMRATSTDGFSAELEYLLSGSTAQFSGREVRASAKQAF